VILWHGILLAAAVSGKGFLSNLATFWGLIFFMIPLFNLIVFLVAAGEGLVRRRLNWSHATLAAITLLPVATLLCARQIL
jgi:hypothetical protein